jgi:hypothetical protein
MLTVAILTAVLLNPGQARAQQWLQTASVISPVSQEAPTAALVDSLVSYLERNDTLKVKRAPNTSQLYTIDELMSTLQEDGWSFAPNNVFISYRFQSDRDGFSETITSLHFIRRPPDGAGDDTNMMFINSKAQGWIINFLENKGTTPPGNMSLTAQTPFSEQMRFARLTRAVPDLEITEIGGQAVREGFEQKKRRLIRKVRGLTFSR